MAARPSESSTGAGTPKAGNPVGSWRLVRQPTGHYSVEPRPSEEDLRRYYAERYYQDPKVGTYAPDYPPLELAHKRRRARLWLRAMAECGVRPARADDRFLEVGCGEGFLLAAAADEGYAVTGIDFSSAGLERWHPALLPRLHVGNAFELLDRAIDTGITHRACALQNVLEHVIDPAGLMRRLRQIVSPGGVLLIQVPNDFSALQLRAREVGAIQRDFWVGVPDHLHYFNLDSGRAFFEAEGFENLDAFADFPIDWFLFHPGSNYVDADRAVGRGAHAARLELDELLSLRGPDAYLAFWRALAATGQGRNICFILRPKP